MSQPKAIQDGEKQPFSATRGSVTVKGYLLHAGLWQLSWYAPDGTRQRKAFKDEAEARRFASVKAAELAGQRSHVRSLTPEETADFETAVEILPAGVTLATAARFYVARHPSNAPRLSVAQVVGELLADLEARGMSGVYQKTAKFYLGRFANDFGCALVDVSGEAFKAWIRGLGIAPKTQQGVRGLVVKLFNFAASKRLVTREHALEIAEVETPKVVVSEIRTMTPADLLKFLSATTPDERPALTLLAFCPLRTAEVARLDWRDIRLRESVLIVNAAVAKVSVRRVVPIPAAGLAWLAAHTTKTGPIWPHQPDPDGNKLAHRLPVIAKAAGVTYSKNALRHSVISALMAREQDAAKVSLWAGNSPRVVSTNYSARWTKGEAEAWFAVMPESPKESNDTEKAEVPG